MKVINFTFNDNSKFQIPFSENAENVVIEQMKKPQNKRKYILGIEFSAVREVEIVNQDL